MLKINDFLFAFQCPENAQGQLNNDIIPKQLEYTDKTFELLTCEIRLKTKKGRKNWPSLSVFKVTKAIIPIYCIVFENGPRISYKEIYFDVYFAAVTEQHELRRFFYFTWEKPVKASHVVGVKFYGCFEI